VSERRRFPPETASVRDVRRFVAGHLDGVPEEQVEVVLLATSELAANSVRHAGTAYTVQVDRTADEVRVTVDDDGEGDPEVQDPGPFTPSGRGLLIVDQLSDDWGSSSRPGHNRVWFAVRLRPDGSPSSGRTSRSQQHERSRRIAPPRTVGRACRRRPGGGGQTLLRGTTVHSMGLGRSSARK
jgi:anti-sigma regulatory factor (Ser/Thr protein kinase)